MDEFVESFERQKYYANYRKRKRADKHESL